MSRFYNFVSPFEIGDYNAVQRGTVIFFFKVTRTRTEIVFNIWMSF